MDYINLADNYGGINYKTSVDLYRFLWRYGKTQKGEKFLNTYKPEIDELSNYIYLGAYEHLIPFTLCTYTWVTQQLPTTSSN